MPGLTDVPGIRVGHAGDAEAATGCTVVLGPFRAACDVRGLATGTRELETLSPRHLVPRADAILLTGGSAYGLDAASGVMRWLEERGAGFDTGAARVPIVPAAVIYDLGVGAADRRPDAAMGRAACDAASDGVIAEGRVGAGTGATVGKLRGMTGAMPGGVGTWSVAGPACTVGALVVVNAVGDVLDEDGRIVAGARDEDGRFIDTARAIRDGALATAGGPLEPGVEPGQNTTLAVIATDAPLDRPGLESLAHMASHGMARRISPVHTTFDGDITFAVSTSAVHHEASPALLLTLGVLAAHALEHAIELAVTAG